MRLFFAVDLPDSLADAFAEVQDRFRDADGLRFTDPAQAHLTLKFLGEAGEDELASVEEAGESAVAAADVAPFDVEVGGLGVFPSEEYVSVLWAGVRDGSDELTRLHEALEAETTALGFDAESHAFTPHLTLARMSDGRGKRLVVDGVRDRDPTVGRFEATAVELKSSTPTADGPEYETVARFPL